MPDTPEDAILVVDELRKSFGGAPVVDGLAFHVQKGECFALLGPDGAGKTTTLEICEGLMAADSGEVRLFGESWDERASFLRGRIGIQLEDAHFNPRQTVRETLDLFRSFYRRGFEVGALIAMARLEARSEARVESLSGGQKRRLALACALAGDPELLFLDEPSAGLDAPSRQQIWALVRALRRAGRTILLGTRRADDAQALCDRIAFLDKGQIVACGPPRDLVRQLDDAQVVEAEIEDETFDEAALSAIPIVRRVRREGARIDVETTDLHAALPAVLVAFHRQSARLKALRTRATTLEDAFVTLTGRGLSDG